MVANEPSSGAEYAEHIRAVLERASQIDSAKGQVIQAGPPIFVRPPVIALLALLLLGVTAYNVRAWSPPPLPEPRPVQEASAQISLVLASSIIETFHGRNDRYPATLEEAGIPEGPYTYGLTPGGGFELFSTEGDVSRRIDENADPGAMLESLGQMVGGSLTR